MKASLDFKGFDQWIENLANAGEQAEDAVTNLLDEIKPSIKEVMVDNLKKTSEEYTGETADSIETGATEKEGNYIFVETTVGGSAAPQATFKEFGNTRQIAEPFVRPTFRGHRLRNALKAGMKKIAQGFGLKL